MERDPAATSAWSAYFNYPGLKAIRRHRMAHRLYLGGHTFLARALSQGVRHRTGIEIHPGATIGEGLFIDHGMGVVIGETCIIGDTVTIYQGVTLGGTGKERGKRHPTIEDCVVIGVGATVLGDITVGHGSKIGAGAVVVNNVPPNCTVVGVPGRIVVREGTRVDVVDLHHEDLPDPVVEMFRCLQHRIDRMDARISREEAASGRAAARRNPRKRTRRTRRGDRRWTTEPAEGPMRVSLSVYNTMARAKEDFVPREEGKVSIYTCGPTVYNHIHIGNARTFLSFDVIRRYLEYRGFDVRFVQNITDVDDKIINRANEEGVEAAEIARPLHGGVHQARCARPRRQASTRPPEGHRDDPADDRDDRAAHRGRPRLRGRRRRLLRGPLVPRLRQAVRPRHRRAGDPGRVSTSTSASTTRSTSRCGSRPSPASRTGRARGAKGRPGWHIECSAMSEMEFGLPFDIHGGGSDLIFPHHENEIAQSEAATGMPFANYWLHGGMLQVDSEKMSKSLGNFLLLKDVLEAYPVPVIRLLMLQTHYRSPLDFSTDRLDEAATAYERIANMVRTVRWARGRPAPRRRARRRGARVARGGMRPDARALHGRDGRRLQHGRRAGRRVRSGETGQRLPLVEPQAALRRPTWRLRSWRPERRDRAARRARCDA